MSYIPRPNASGDTLSASRDPIRTNFTVLQDRFDENHVDLDGGAGGGKHKFLQMPEQSSAPATAVNELGVYSKVANSISELFLRRESSGTEIQLTTGDVRANTRGYTFLPGGVLLQWGIITAPSNGGTVTFTDDSGIDFPNNIWCLTTTAISKVGGTSTTHVSAPRKDTVLTTGYTYDWAASTSYVEFYWQAIGN